MEFVTQGNATKFSRIPTVKYITFQRKKKDVSVNFPVFFEKVWGGKEAKSGVRIFRERRFLLANVISGSPADRTKIPTVPRGGNFSNAFSFHQPSVGPPSSRRKVTWVSANL
jgi:hypothetical protein